MADCSTQIESARLDDLEAAERIERMEEEEAAGAATTPAMRAAAFASDERERTGRVGDGQADFAHRCMGAGYVEMQLAIEG